MASMGIITAAIYLRKSTQDDGKSAAAQEHDIREGAELLAINVVLVYSEGEAAPSSIDLYARWSSSSLPRHGVGTW